MKRKFVSKGMLVGVAGTLLVALASCQPGETKEKTAGENGFGDGEHIKASAGNTDQ